MSLQKLMTLSKRRNHKKEDEAITEERIRAQMDNIRNQIAFFREYPDLFIDYIKGPDCNFKFYFYQRV